MRIKITIQINQTAHTSLLKLSVIQPGHRNVNTPSSGHYSQAGKEKRAELASLILVSKGVGVEDTKADLPVSFFHGYPCEWVARVARVSRMRKRDRETRSGRSSNVARQNRFVASSVVHETQRVREEDPLVINEAVGDCNLAHEPPRAEEIGGGKRESRMPRILMRRSSLSPSFALSMLFHILFQRSSWPPSTLS